MPDVFVLDRTEEEALVRAVESGVQVQRLHHFFVWTRSHVQGLVPHDTLLCMQFGDDDVARHLECLNSQPVDANALDKLCNIEDGLGVRLAHACRAAGELPRIFSADEAAPEDESLRSIREDLRQMNWSAAMVHGSALSRSGAICFALLTRAATPSKRHLHVLGLLAPVLHWAFIQVVLSGDASSMHRALTSPLSARELEILHWLIRGKANLEIAEALGLSTLTVKNHLQRIYRKLQVRNRVQAVARCKDLKLPIPEGELVSDRS